MESLFLVSGIMACLGLSSFFMLSLLLCHGLQFKQSANSGV